MILERAASANFRRDLSQTLIVDVTFDLRGLSPCVLGLTARVNCQNAGRAPPILQHGAMIQNILYISTIVCIVSANLSSSKRGLIYIQSEETSDDSIWNAPNSDLTWYYNYGASPTDGLDNSKLQFVPMLWGPPSDGDTPFNDTVNGLINGGMSIKYILSFNEPDLCNNDGYGGSCLAAAEAAQIWIEQVEPLKQLGVKLGAPAVTSAPPGTEWLESFFSHCDGKCNTDFLTLHWYGPSAYLPNYVGEMKAKYENLSTAWITEFADPNVSLEESQSFYNQSTDFFDNWAYVGHCCLQKDSRLTL